MTVKITSELFLSQRIRTELVEHCLVSIPFEACGFLIGTTGYLKTVFRIKHAENQATVVNKYTIDPFEYYTLEHSLEGTYLSIIGFYHSHTNGSAHPSRYDIQDAWPGYSYLITGVTTTQEVAMKSWQLNPKTGASQEEAINIILEKID